MLTKINIGVFGVTLPTPFVTSIEADYKGSNFEHTSASTFKC